MSEPKLLPCPFCGGKPKEFTQSGDSHSIMCNNCHIEKYGKTSDKVVQKWNRRVPAVGQWTTEPNENGLYVVQVRGYGIFKLTVVKVMGGCVKDWHGSTYAKEDFCKMNDSLMWLKLDVPSLPEGKESGDE